MRNPTKTEPAKFLHRYASLAPLILAGFLHQQIISPAVSATFSNPGTIVISDHTAATPYPSSILVSGLAGSVSDVYVTLTGFSHTYTSDVNILLQGPFSPSLLLMSHAGSGTTSSLNLTFDDSAPSPLPQSGLLQSGIFDPTQYGSVTLPAPAPAGPYNTALSSFNGSNPNGTWSLFVFDDAFADVGAIMGGWSLAITTVPEPSTWALLSLGLPALLVARRRRP